MGAFAIRDVVSFTALFGRFLGGLLLVRRLLLRLFLLIGRGLLLLIAK